MLQVDVCPFASDALEDAMRLAQTKSLNSYTFSDCINFLNYVWSDIYSQICMIDSGYYSKTVRLTKKLTKLPRFVKNSVMIYSAQGPQDHNRILYRQANNMELLDRYTYLISGTDLWCPDAEHSSVWLEYCPQPAQIFFTHHNRDPKLYPDGHDAKRNSIYNLYQLIPQEFVIDTTTTVPNGVLYTYDNISKTYVVSHDTQRVDGKNYYIPQVMFNGRDISDMTVTPEQIASVKRWVLKHRNPLNTEVIDITADVIQPSDENGTWELKYITCDFPYIFCSYQHSVTAEWKSGFFDKDMQWTDYNPFEWVGRNDNVEYLECHYNDKTGMGVIVRDWNDFDEILLDTEHLPEKINSVIYVENYFEYKCSDGTVAKMTQGYWYNRYATDYNYEKVPYVIDLHAVPDPDEGDVVNLNGTIKRYTVAGGWKKVANIDTVARKEERPRIKELGWTPDTKLVYPAPEVYRYLVARLAEKFSALNESNIMGVQSELADARFAFQAFLKKDKSAWERMRNVNPATVTDWL